MPLFRGTPGRDNLHGTAGRDTLYGLDGNDTINPGRGGDWLHAGPGADVVFWDQDGHSRHVVDTYIGGARSESYDPDPYFVRSDGDRLMIGANLGLGGFRVTYASSEDGVALDGVGNRLNFTEC